MAPRKTAPVKHVALLRGINVGKAKRIAMADLRALCEGLGYENVRTLLNSGNVVFTAPRADAQAAAKIEREIERKLGVSSRVIAFTGAELDAIIAENPFTECDENPSRFLVMLLAHDLDRAPLRQLAAQRWGPERLGVGTHAVYLWCANGILDSAALTALNKVTGDAGTTRNWATMLKLQALTRESSE
ncbi:MAG: DUF1697 domain-containing protein [Gemmatimonadota bacterium]